MHECGSPTDRRRACAYAEQAATIAAQKVVSLIFDVDVEKPEQVKKLRRTVMFSENLMTLAEKGGIAFIVGVVGLFVAALWTGLKMKLGGE